MTGLRICCSDSVPYCYGMRRLALLSDRIERGQVKVYLVCYLAHLHTHRPAHKPKGSRSIPDPHAHGIRAYTHRVSRPIRIFYVRVAHTPIFIFAYRIQFHNNYIETYFNVICAFQSSMFCQIVFDLRQISNPIPDQPLTQLYTPSGMNRRLTHHTIPARL